MQNLYPTLLHGQRDADLQPAGRLDELAPRTPRTRRAASTASRCSASRQLHVRGRVPGSRGYKGINQIEMNPAILTPEQAAAVAAAQNANAIPSVQARGVCSRSSAAAYADSGHRRTGRQRRRGALRVQRDLRLGQQALLRRAAVRRLVHLQQVDEQQRRVARRGRHRTVEPAAAEHVRLRGRVEPIAVRPAAPVRGELHLGDPRPARGLDWVRLLGGWQLSGVTQVQSGRPFTIFTGVDSNGDGNTGSDRPNINPSGSFVWDDDHKTFTNNGY